MHVIHLTIFRDFALGSDGFELALSANGSPCSRTRWASWICTQNAVKTCFYNCQCSVHNSRLGKSQKKGTENTKKRPQIIKIPIRMGLISSHDLCVWRNMVSHLWWNFYFTNYGHGRFAQDYNHRRPPQLLQITRGPQVILVPCE